MSPDELTTILEHLRDPRFDEAIALLQEAIRKGGTRITVSSRLIPGRELVDIYERRRDHCREIGLPVAGIDPLVDLLIAESSANWSIVTFFGGGRWAVVFLKQGTEPSACIVGTDSMSELTQLFRFDMSVRDEPSMSGDEFAGMLQGLRDPRFADAVASLQEAVRNGPSRIVSSNGLIPSRRLVEVYDERREHYLKTGLHVAGIDALVDRLATELSTSFSILCFFGTCRWGVVLRTQAAEPCACIAGDKTDLGRLDLA